MSFSSLYCTKQGIMLLLIKFCLHCSQYQDLQIVQLKFVKMNKLNHYELKH